MINTPFEERTSTLDVVDEEDVYVFPTSFAQQRLWFLDQLEPGSPFYNIPVAVRLTGMLDLTALARSVNMIVRRHETLRTTFASQDGVPVQVISPNLSLHMPVTDLQALSGSELHKEVQRLADEEARLPFDLDRGPLTRIRVLKVEETQHVLLLTMHHIISDGWSINIFVGELGALYNSAVLPSGDPFPLPELPIQYADFAHWQRQRLSGEVLDRQLEYWRNHLGGDLPVLELPTDRPRPAVQTFRGASISRLIPNRLCEKIKILALHEGATFFMTLLATFQVLLHRYSGQEDICVGTPVANRNRAETEGLIGFFVNTLVMRTDLSGPPTFRELLRRVRASTMKAYENQDLPFEMVVEAVCPKRDASYNPLFQAMFILQNAAAKAIELPALTLELIEAHTGASTFDLTMSASEETEGLDVAVEYNTDLFDRPTMERLLERFEFFLKGIAADPDSPISDLPFLTDAERNRVLVEWNRTESVTPRGQRCVHRLFEAQADLTPEAIAVLGIDPVAGPGDALTYRELNERANRLAWYLNGVGVNPETVVGICMEKSLDMIVAVLGTLKAGGAYLALDPSYPPDRLRFMVEDSGVGVILTQKKFGIRNSEFGISRMICLDTDWQTMARESDQNPNVDVEPDNLCYVVYTSGSTGRPKGVLVCHQSLSNAYLAWEQAYNLDRVTTHFQMASFAFDVFSGDLVRALCSGGRLILCPKDFLLDSEDLYRLMRDMDVECAEFVPAVLRSLMDYLARTRQNLGFMRLLICGSDFWSVEEYKCFCRSIGPGTRLINSFGLAEATIDSTYFEGRCTSLPGDRAVPIGHPFPGNRIYVLDRQLEPQPIGIPGELFAGGTGVARGYLKKPALTAERFVPDPFEEIRGQRSEVRSQKAEGQKAEVGDQKPEDKGRKAEVGLESPEFSVQSSVFNTSKNTQPATYNQQPATRNQQSGGTRLYRTGDMARYLEDGNIEFLGRMDYQVKIRGFRIETGEIVTTLKEHPAVQDAVVIAVSKAQPQSPRKMADHQLAAYVVPHSRGDLPLSDLRAFLKARLPDYMVPSIFTVLDSLPLSPNGKVDRKALPPPECPVFSVEEECIAPRTPTEEMLAAIWGELLGLERISLRDNFFDLGGHSLLATQLVSRVRSVFKVEIPLRTLFERPSIEDFAQQVEIAKKSDFGVKAPPIVAVSRSLDLPLSFSQQRLWFLDQLEPNSPFYNLPEVVRLTGPLSMAALEHSLNETIRRHETLRTAFRTVNGKPVQEIIPRLSLDLPITDLGEVPGPQKEEDVQRIVRMEMERPFDLTRPPLLRVRIIRLGNEEHVFLLVMHHIVGDEWSTDVLVREIALLYDSLRRGAPSPLRDLPLQYADFAYWQRNWIQGEVLDNHLRYWRKQLTGLPPLLDLPTDRPRPAVQSYRGDYSSFAMEEALTSAVKAVCRQEGVTLFMFLLSAFQALLYRYTGQESVAVGSPIAGRNRAEIEGLIGFFINTLVLRADLSRNMSFRQLLAQVRETTLDAYAHQDLPFEMVVDGVQPERNLTHSPLFQVMFVLQNMPPRSISVSDSGLTISPVEAHSGTSKFDLTLFMLDEGERLSGALEYDTDLFNAATIERMLSHYEILIRGAVRDLDRPVAHIPISSEAEKQQLIEEWNDTEALLPEDLCAHDLVELQASLTPDALAATYQDRALTYAELSRRSSQVARYLRGIGAGPETLVGLSMERSLEMLVGILGILKAGAAYVPLDPAYPPERLRYMIEDSGIGVILTLEGMLEDRFARKTGSASDDRFARKREEKVHFRSFPTSDLRPLTSVFMDTDWHLIASESDENPIVDMDPENLAYVIYTSGSTGRPKGAMITHGGLVNYLAWVQRAYPLDEGRGSPVHSSISFDLTVTSLFAPLISGRMVLLLPEDAGVEALGNTTESEADFSLVKITPAHLQAIGEMISPQAAPGWTRAFIIGGENLVAEQIALWQSFAPETALVNEYGPTETVVGCCVYWTPRGHEHAVIPIGRPIINTTLYGLDPCLNPMPIDAPGELYIGGPGVARGYLRRPDLTAERFVPNLFVKVRGQRSEVGGPGGARLYRTGDLVRFLPDGNLECLGRIDHQVKIRGFRVELEEIEAVLGQHPYVREVAVWPYEEGGHRRLAAYLTLNGEKSLQTADLRDFLLEKLPVYMVPSAFVVLERMPLTHNGKVDRKNLPMPGPRGLTEGEEYVAPSNIMERIMAEIWAELLGIENVSVHDNFFELGGDSILCIQVVSRAGRQGIHLTPRQIFEFPTIAGLLKVADTKRISRAEQSVVTGPVPLTPIQHLFFDLNLPEPHHWNQSLLLSLDEPLDHGHLRTVLHELLLHHDALRLRFTPTDHGWEQFNESPGPEPPLTWMDLSELGTEVLQEELKAVSVEVQPGLDLTRGPLIRFVYFDMGEGHGGWVLIVMHHLITDAVSWQILIEDFQSAYREIHSGRVPRLPPKTTSFRDWAHTLLKLSLSEGLPDELEYWTSALQGPGDRLPIDFALGENTESSSLNVLAELALDETARLTHEATGVHGATVHEVLLTAAAWAVSRWAGTGAVLIDVEGHGREYVSDEIDLSRTVGWFTTLYPVHLNLGEATHPSAALQIVKEELHKVPRKGLGYGILRYLHEGSTPAPLRDLPEPEISFNFFGLMEWTSSESDHLGFASPPTGTRSARARRTHLIDINGGVVGGRLQMEWCYSGNFHRASTLQKLADDFLAAVRSIITASPAETGDSDFELFGWDRDEVDKIRWQIENQGQ